MHNAREPSQAKTVDDVTGEDNTDTDDVKSPGSWHKVKGHGACGDGNKRKRGGGRLCSRGTALWERVVLLCGNAAAQIGRMTQLCGHEHNKQAERRMKHDEPETLFQVRL